MVEPDLAELVDHDRRVRHRRIAQRAVQERRLAAAEKTGEDGDGCVGQAALNLMMRRAVDRTVYRRTTSSLRAGKRVTTGLDPVVDAAAQNQNLSANPTTSAWIAG